MSAALAVQGRDVHTRLDTLLSRLEGVRQTGQDKYRADCPNGHTSKGTLLISISQKDGEKINFHCFASCEDLSALSAIGMSLRDLYPQRNDDHQFLAERHPFPATDVLRAIAHEALVVAIAAEDMAKGEKLSAEDRERLLLAASLIRKGVNYVS